MRSFLCFHCGVLLPTLVVLSQFGPPNLALMLLPRLVSRKTSPTARRVLPPSRDGRALGNKVGEVLVFVCHVGEPGLSRTATPKVIVGADLSVREAFSS